MAVPAICPLLFKEGYLTSAGTWYWEYLKAADRWLLHTPCYEPEVSIQLARQNGQVIIGVFKETTMPKTLARFFIKMVHSFNFFGEADKGIIRINIKGDELIKANEKATEFFRVINLEKQGRASRLPVATGGDHGTST